MRQAEVRWTIVVLALVAAGCGETDPDPGMGRGVASTGGTAVVPPGPTGGAAAPGAAGGSAPSGGFAGGSAVGGGSAGGGSASGGVASGGAAAAGGAAAGAVAAGGSASGGAAAGSASGGVTGAGATAGGRTAGGGTTGGLIGGAFGGLLGGGGGSTAGSEPVAVPMGTSCLKGAGNFTANGPYRVKKKDVTIGSQGAYTIFWPDPLEASCKHPIVAWGNGTAVTGSDIYGFYQEHAASYGIVVIASHNDNVGAGTFHTAAIDYMLKENMTQGSEFFGKLGTKVGTSGHSQGGAGANVAASHPNVEAIGNVQGAFGSAPRGAAFLCLTGTADIATEGCKSAVNSATSPALYANWEGGDHISTATLLGFITGDPGTKQYQRLYTAWFRCFLADDSVACAMFKGGAACPVCKEMGWAEIFAKNI
jgi:hypothetical protein